jgi:hypothetical protein
MSKQAKTSIAVSAADTNAEQPLQFLDGMLVETEASRAAAECLGVGSQVRCVKPPKPLLSVVGNVSSVSDLGIRVQWPIANSELPSLFRDRFFKVKELELVADSKSKPGGDNKDAEEEEEYIRKMELKFDNPKMADDHLADKITMLVNTVGRFYLPSESQLDSRDDGKSLVVAESFEKGELLLLPLIKSVSLTKPDEPHILVHATIGKGDDKCRSLYYGLLASTAIERQDPFTLCAFKKSPTPKGATLKFVEIVFQDAGLKTSSKHLNDLAKCNKTALEIRLDALTNESALEVGAQLSVALGDQRKYIKHISV